MPLPSVVFTKQEGGLGRPQPGEDHISGLIYYRDSGVALPTGFGSAHEKTFFSLASAEAAGITDGHAAYGRLWYHIREFFRLAQKGVLHVGVYDAPANYATHTYPELTTLQQFASGKIRQVAVYLDEVAGVSTAIIAALQTQAAALYTAHMPLVVLVAFDLDAVSDLSTLANIRTGTNYYVSCVIGQDGGAKGAEIYTADEVSVTTIGAVLGSLAFGQVHESIAWPRKYKPSDTELDVAAFANGDLVNQQAESLLDTLNDRGYIFLRKFIGLDGSYWNDTPTAAATTSDYAYIEANRTIDKAIRLAYAALVQEVNGPVLVDADTGKLSESYIEYLKGISDQAIAQMARDGELSGYQTIIDPEQNVLTSSTIEVTIELVGVGVSRKLSINIGFKTQLSS